MADVKRIKHGNRVTIRMPKPGKVTIKTVKKRIPRKGSNTGSSRSHWQMEIETSVDPTTKPA